MKKIIKKYWAGFLAIFCLFSCVINIVFACLFCDKAPNIFTTISGWVSSIATIILGCIALWQNKQYKKDNEELMKKQYDFEVFKTIVDKRENYINTMKLRLYQFCDKFNYKKVTSWLAELLVICGERPNCSFNDARQPVYIAEFAENMAVEYTDLKQMIVDDWCRGSDADEFIKHLDKYFIALKTDISKINYCSIHAEIESFNTKYSQMFLELIRLKNKYISWLDADINIILTQECDNLEYVKKHYCYIK